MPGLGVVVNALAIVLGSLIGLAVGRLVKKRMRESIIQVQGLAVIAIGMMGSIAALTALSQAPGMLGRYSIIVFVAALIIGTLIGEILALETRLKYMGKALQRRLQSDRLDVGESNSQKKGQKSGHKNGSNKFVQGFMTATLVYCVGAMAILGSIQDGLGNPDTLFIKSLLDGTISIFLAATLGMGVMFSAVPVLILQGFIALLAFAIGDVIPMLAINGIAAVGGVLIVGIGLNLTAGLKLRIGNMVPAVFVAMAVFWLLAGIAPV